MTGKDLIKDEFVARAYDAVEAEAIKKLDSVFGTELTEITQEESDRYELIADYKYKAQEHLETAGLYLNRLKEV